MIVMQHQFEYLQNREQKKLNSSLVVFGEDPRYTAMAKTVGLPVAIATKLILNGEITSKGVKIPTTKDIYIPVLKELEEHGITYITASRSNLCENMLVAGLQENVDSGKLMIKNTVIQEFIDATKI